MQNIINNRWIRWSMPPLLVGSQYAILFIFKSFDARELSIQALLVSIFIFYFVWESGKLIHDQLITKNLYAINPFTKTVLHFAIHLCINLILLVPFYICLKYLQIQYKNANESIRIYHYVFAVAAISIITIIIFALQNSLLHIDRLFISTLESNRIVKEKEIQLLEAVVTGEEKERSRIAKDLHDGVAGMLAASKIYFTTIQSQSNFLYESKEFQYSLQLIDEAAMEIRKTAHSLMPEILLQYGLDEALRKYCQTPGSACIEYYSINSSRLHSNFELTVYRIVQELLHYITKHGKATQVMVQLSHQQTILSITIEDNTVNTHLSKNLLIHDLDSIKCRVQLLNGTMELESNQEGNSVYMEFDIAYLRKEG